MHRLNNNVNKVLPPRTPDDEVRRFLAICTVFLIALNLIIYAITRDIGVLAGTTVVGIAVYSVFRYYFSQRDNNHT